MMRCTTPLPVNGSEHSSTILYAPSLAVCSISTMTRLAPWTRSIAPPIPLTIFPGIIQLAMSPWRLTCMAPRIAASILPPRIIPNEVAESKNDAPRRTVTVSLPALIRSASSSPVLGVGADAEDAVLGLQHQLDVVVDVVRHQRRQPDAEVDVGAVGQLRGRARGHLLTRPGHQLSTLFCTVFFSIRLSAACSGVSATTRCT